MKHSCICNMPTTSVFLVFPGNCEYGLCDEVVEYSLIPYLWRDGGGGGGGVGRKRTRYEGVVNDECTSRKRVGVGRRCEDEEGDAGNKVLR
jgi:hypothetical protein